MTNKAARIAICTFAILLAVLLTVSALSGFIHFSHNDNIEAVGSITDAPAETEPPQLVSSARHRYGMAACIACIVLAAAAIISFRLRNNKPDNTITVKDNSITVMIDDSIPKTADTFCLDDTPAKNICYDFARVHGQGKRSCQQDCLGITPVLEGKGIFAVVADGIGGLGNGDQVSSETVKQALNFMGELRPGQLSSALPEMLSSVTSLINSMLGPSGLYQSGSTLAAVLAFEDRFSWISVGDSRIYLYREGWLNQLTRDHNLFQDWMPELIEGKRSYSEAAADPEGKKLTSFIGMGALTHVDSCEIPMRILPGDRIVLMSDGVYDTLPADTIADILKQYPNIQTAAKALDKAVCSANNPHQDNYTVVILAF